MKLLVQELQQNYRRFQWRQMEYNLNDLYPQLNQKIDPAQLGISISDLQSNSFFIDLVDQIIHQYNHANLIDAKPNQKNKVNSGFHLKDISQFLELRTLMVKAFAKIVPVRVPKGTIVYTVGMAPDQGYFLLHGCIQLLYKKNNWQKLQNFEGHTIFKPEHRIEYLQNNFNIDSRHFELLENLFYEEKMLFNWMPFHKVYSKGYFGFRELLRGCLRTKMAIAVQECILLKVRKADFDKFLKEFDEKRENYVMYNMLANTRSEIAEQIMSKLAYAFNSAQLLSFDRDEIILRENDFTSGVYFLLNGEVTVSKDVKIEVPKKYLTNENRGQFIKQMVVKLHKVVKNTYIGEVEPLLSIKNRQFTFQATQNNTILIKFDATAFIKSIAESAMFEREMMIAAKYKYSSAMDAYTRHKSQIIKSYFNQFQELDHKKKEKNIVNMLNNQGNFKQNELYQLFKKEGVFYRDSFERLEGFQQFQSKYDPKRSSIHRHKIKSTQQLNPPPNKEKLRRQIKYSEQKSPKNQQNDVSFEATKRMLMSPGKTSNPFEIMNSDMMSKLTPISEHTSLERQSSSNLRKKKKMFSKFQQLKKDESIYKRVLIQNGRFETNKQTNKSNMVQAIVNHQFDEVVKQCMTRKNQGLRKALVEHRDDIFKNEFQKTVSSLPNRSSSLKGFSNTSYGFTCKGTEQMKKKLEKFKYTRRAATNGGEKPFEDSKGLEECIGFNRQPLSSQIKTRSTFLSPTKTLNRSPQKIVLLNHMMKPITYTSSQI